MPLTLRLGSRVLWLAFLWLRTALTAASVLPTAWDEAPRRPLPGWFNDAKLGVFVHWGPYAVPGFAPRSDEPSEMFTRGGWELWFARHSGAEWYANSLRIPGSPVERFHRRTYGEKVRYEDFGPKLQSAAAAWNPADWSELFRRAGAHYVVFSAKHHDGYLMWPSRFSATAPGESFASPRDFVGELAAAVRKSGLRFGVAYSGGLDWSVTRVPITNIAELFISTPTPTNYLHAVDRHWRELIFMAKPDLLWNDLGSPADLRVEALHEEYYASVPEGVVNDRFSLGLYPGPARKPRADFATPALDHRDRQQGRPFEVTRPLGRSAGFNREEREEDLLALPDLVRLLVDVASRNGRLSLAVGPDASGIIPALHRRRLEELGAWMSIHGEAIHATRPWLVPELRTQEGLDLRFTERGSNWFVHVLNPARTNRLRLHPFRSMPDTLVQWLGVASAATWRSQSNAIEVEVPLERVRVPVLTLKISPQPVWLARP